MTQITRDDVVHLATLSGLTLADDEVEGLRTDLSNILSYINQLDELDTDGVEPTYQVNGQINVMRDDVIELSEVSSEQLVDLAPEHDKQQIKVPKVL